MPTKKEDMNKLAPGAVSDKAVCAGLIPGGPLLQGQKNDDEPGAPDFGLATKVRTRTKRPSLYRVLLLNDDFTPMEFVVSILKSVFNKNSADAEKIMMHVHVNGVGECGVYPYEVAETKVMQVMDAAQKGQHPLQCVMEKK